jgi:hypothetical protein
MKTGGGIVSPVLSILFYFDDAFVATNLQKSQTIFKYELRIENFSTQLVTMRLFTVPF